ncbi:MAG: CHRD domain-containing protein [Gammaproteobacteria bacterium]
MKTLPIMSGVLFLAASGVAYGNDAVVFRANLAGEQEVAGLVAPQPGVTTETTGRFRIKFDSALTKAEFRLRVGDGVKVTQAHLHCAPAGVNGPVVAFLFNVAPVPGPGGVDVDGLLAEGELTNADVVPDVDFASDPACGKTIDNIASLRAAMLQGCIYVNVHTEANPAGEVRGQVIPLDDD